MFRYGFGWNQVNLAVKFLFKTFYNLYKAETYVLETSLAIVDILRKEQKQMPEACAKLLPIAIPTIEQSGGGSVRCMMAEVFLEKRKMYSW